MLASVLLLSATAATAQSVAAAPAYREVTDEAGRVVRVPVEVRRIVSLAPNMTETVYALGAQDRLVGVTTYCDYPPAAAAKEKVGGPLSPSLEQIVALRPDVVLAAKTANRRETLEALERLGIAVYGTNPKSVEEVLDSTRRVADAIGAREQGEALVAQLRARLAALKQRLSGRPERRVLFVVWHDPLISVGRNTFLADALRWAGASAFVLVGFLGLFAFFDLIRELADLGKVDYHLRQVFTFVLLSMPTHAYELFPVVVLIDTL